ncbi:MAG: Fic family protein [Legionellales bacterium]|nr:Fic family protein [Legionellales bacterium]
MNTIHDIIPNPTKALFLAQRQLSELVCDAVNLEGIHYTLPEVQTLLDGITVGGHKLSDERVTLNQASAWKHLFQLIKHHQFELSKHIVCELHNIAGANESLTWGSFRTGNVTIAGTDYLPPAPNELDKCWNNLIVEVTQITDIYDRAITLFLQMARLQFFYDVNKRMGRFMMNGLLLQAGYPVINLPASKQQEFNQLMLAFYPSNHMQPMVSFMKNCLDPRIINIMCEQ